MSSIAKYLTAKGHKVGGYDLRKSDITNKLEKNGVEINYENDLNSIPLSFKNESVIVIYTPAISQKNEQLLFF